MRAPRRAYGTSSGLSAIAMAPRPARGAAWLLNSCSTPPEGGQYFSTFQRSDHPSCYCPGLLCNLLVSMLNFAPCRSAAAWSGKPRSRSNRVSGCWSPANPVQARARWCGRGRACCRGVAAVAACNLDHPYKSARIVRQQQRYLRQAARALARLLGLPAPLGRTRD